MFPYFSSSKLLNVLSFKGKIINDPVYGFLRFSEPELMRVIAHPYFQRLRSIKQMGMAHLVYPGAVHTRLHHSLGACYLMGMALERLRIKGITISPAEWLGAKMAVLLHDIGHGPFSHALEYTLIDGVRHEAISRLIMQHLNAETGGMLDMAISIFQDTHPTRFLHQLVSGQLDVDRMDYLNRDSFYTGVSEGVIGYDRILEMLTVHNGELAVEEKGVHSVEKFIIARRLMYWQVYLHKTVLGAEYLLIHILRRAKELALAGKALFATPALSHFLHRHLGAQDFEDDPQHLSLFCQLDDSDILASVKVWQKHSDQTLALLCRMMLERKLYKVQLSAASLDEFYQEKEAQVRSALSGMDINPAYFVFTGSTSNDTYNVHDERIRILMKNGMDKDISEVEDALVTQAVARSVRKNYVCYYVAINEL
jgi:HD superfamily phosphohydrolase